MGIIPKPEFKSMQVPEEPERNGHADPEARRKAVLASISGSLYSDLVEAFNRMSPDEMERHIEEMRALVRRYEGPGGP